MNREQELEALVVQLRGVIRRLTRVINDLTAALSRLVCRCPETSKPRAIIEVIQVTDK